MSDVDSTDNSCCPSSNDRQSAAEPEDRSTCCKPEDTQPPQDHDATGQDSSTSGTSQGSLLRLLTPTTSSVIVCSSSVQEQKSRTDKRNQDTQSTDTVSEPGPNRVRVKIVFTKKQLKTLYHCFSRQKYLTSDKMESLAQEIKVTKAQVMRWFQKERVKHKRQQQLVIARYNLFRPWNQRTMMRPAFMQNAAHNPAFYQAAMHWAPNPAHVLYWRSRWSQAAAPWIQVVCWPRPLTILFVNPLSLPPSVFPSLIQQPSTPRPSTSGDGVSS